MRFADRSDAGRHLALAVAELQLVAPVVLGLPRGGVVVAAEVADALGAPLDVIVVRKLGVPGQPELAMGAIGEDGVRVFNERVLRLVRVSSSAVRAVEARERGELDRRLGFLRRGGAPVEIAGRVVIVVDDGIATGATASAACQVVRARGAARIVLAVPVAATDTLERLRPEVDDIVCLDSPADFAAVGQAYVDFSPTSDDEVAALLAAR